MEMDMSCSFRWGICGIHISRYASTKEMNRADVDDSHRL